MGLNCGCECGRVELHGAAGGWGDHTLDIKQSFLTRTLSSFLSVAVITHPSHGLGRRFDPGRKYESFDIFVFNYKIIVTSNNLNNFLI